MDENTVTEKQIDKLAKRLDNCLQNIQSTEDYYPVDTVQEKYDMAMKQYDKADKAIKLWYENLEED